jgi:hypothetical protein
MGNMSGVLINSDFVLEYPRYHRIQVHLVFAVHNL